MGGSRKVARLGLLWGLIACGAAATARAQTSENSKPAPAPRLAPALTLINPSQPSTYQASGDQHSQRRAGPWLPQPWQSVQPDVPHNNIDLGANHTIVISTLGLIIIGAIVLLLLL